MFPLRLFSCDEVYPPGTWGYQYPYVCIIYVGMVVSTNIFTMKIIRKDITSYHWNVFMYLFSLSFLIISVTKHVRLPEVLNTVTAELVWLVNVEGGDGGEDDLVN